MNILKKSILLALIGTLLLPGLAEASNLSSCTITATFVRYKSLNRGAARILIVDVESTKAQGTDPKVCKGLQKKSLEIQTNRNPSFNNTAFTGGELLKLRLESSDDNRTGKTHTNWTFLSELPRKEKPATPSK